MKLAITRRLKQSPDTVTSIMQLNVGPALSDRYKFSPAIHRQHIYYLVSMRLKYHYEFMGWDGLLLLNILHNNQLKELGDKSNNAIVNLPVHVFQGLIFLKEVN